MPRSNDNEDLNKFLLELIMYQDQLLQNYRLIFISSQSILISIALLTLVSEKTIIITSIAYFIFLILGVIFLWYWGSITENRELDVSYCHMQLLKLERNPLGQPDKQLTNDEKNKPFDSFKNWQQFNKDAKISKLDNYDHHLRSSSARKKMKHLRYWFYIIWIFSLIIWIIRFLISLKIFVFLDI